MMHNLIEDLKNLFLEQERLIGRFLSFSKEFREFEYDTSGINFDEAEDIERKAKIIAHKIFDEINNSNELYSLDIKEIMVVKNIIVFEAFTEEDKNEVKIIFDEDGFVLELRAPEEEVIEEAPLTEE